MSKKRRSTVGWVVTLAFLGLVFDGYDLVVYGAVLPRFLLGEPGNAVLGTPLTAAQAGVVGSYAMIGVTIGALVAGTLGDIIGRRGVVLGSLAWFSLGMLLSAWAPNVTMFSIWRVVTGLGVGALVGITGAIVAEFAPPGKKNLATALTYAGVPVGSLLSALLAMGVLPPMTAPISAHTQAFHIMFSIGALPLVTVLPLAIWKMPESVAWLASRGKMEKARQVSLKTGIPVPPPPPAPVAGAKASESRAGWAGLFSSYLVPTILIGLISAGCLLLVYSLNTWLPQIMQGVMGPTGALALLLVLNGGALVGTLFGSRFADKYSPQRVVAWGFLIGVLSIGLIGLVVSTIALPSAADIKKGITAEAGVGMVLLLLVIIVFVGVGTSGVQTLIYAMAANYYRTNVRAAGVAWTGGFGRLGGIAGPILGGVLAAAFAANIEYIFYVLAGIALLAMIFTIVLPKPKTEATVAQINPAAAAVAPAPVEAVTAPRLYETIMVVVDETGNELTRDRVTKFVALTGRKVHLVYLAPERVMAAEVSVNDVDIDPKHVGDLQEYVNRVSSLGIPTTGQVLSATLFTRGEAVVQLAEELHADLIILNTEEGGQRAKAELAEQVARSNPLMAVLIARSTQSLQEAGLSFAR
ncbi:MFS transporter [Granulicoccus phenolivorans]|uniref:MFS transporter n=1 Tax=Granulicoccus phenolivorans TaxID=266854 RepID=UPI00068490A4|nr:MFS transporter [Granulicoccus phenolivorans]